MHQGGNRIGVALFAVTSQAAFWILYSQTANIVGSIGITAAVSICLLRILFWLSKVDQRKQQ